MIEALLSFVLSTPSIGDLGPVPKDAVRVFLVRHGQALSNLTPAPNLSTEELDHLTPFGRAQSRRAGSALRPETIARIWSSPASRARETAEEIRAVLGPVDVRIETRLRPLDLGRASDGTPLSSDARVAEWKAGRDPQPRDGESLEQVGRRVIGLLESLVRDHSGRSVIFVAHNEVIGALLGSINDRPGALSYPPGIANGSISVVETRVGQAPKAIVVNYIPTEESAPER